MESIQSTRPILVISTERICSLLLSILGRFEGVHIWCLTALFGNLVIFALYRSICATTMSKCKWQRGSNRQKWKDIICMRIASIRWVSVLGVCITAIHFCNFHPRWHLHFDNVEAWVHLDSAMRIDECCGCINHTSEMAALQEQQKELCFLHFFKAIRTREDINTATFQLKL